MFVPSPFLLVYLGLLRTLLGLLSSLTLRKANRQERPRDPKRTYEFVMSQGQEQPVVVEPLHQGEGGPQTRGRPPTHEETSRRRPIVARGRGRSGQGNAGDGGNARQPVDADVEQIEAHGGSRRRGSPDPNADQGAGGVAGDPRREYSRQQSVIRRQKANIKAFKFALVAHTHRPQ